MRVCKLNQKIIALHLKGSDSPGGVSLAFIHKGDVVVGTVKRRQSEIILIQAKKIEFPK